MPLNFESSRTGVNITSKWHVISIVADLPYISIATDAGHRYSLEYKLHFVWENIAQFPLATQSLQFPTFNSDFFQK